MIVRKKILDTNKSGDILNLSPHLNRVREAIRQLSQDDEGVNMETPAAAAIDSSTSPESSATEPKKTVKKVTKKAVKKTAKKAAPKKPVAVPKKSSSKPAIDGTPLVAICQRLKMEPRRARRILRTAKVKNPGRWTWTTVPEVAKIEKMLKEAAAQAS